MIKEGIKLFDEYVRGPINPLDFGPKRSNFKTTLGYQKSLDHWIFLHELSFGKWGILELVNLVSNKDYFANITLPLTLTLGILCANNLIHAVIGYVKDASID